MKDGLYRVVTPYLCAGFVIKNGELYKCAPILRKKFNYWKTKAEKVMIVYETCWLVECGKVIKNESREVTGVGEWRAWATFSTHLRPDQIIEEIDEDAKNNTKDFNRDDLYYNERSGVLWKVSESRHYTTTRKLAESGENFQREYEQYKGQQAFNEALRKSKANEKNKRECPL